MSVGLVLEGGGMRAMFTAGVLDVLMEADIRTDRVVAVSAGALFGVNYLSGQKGRAIRYNKRFNHDPNYMGLRPLVREGNIVSTAYAYDRVPHVLDPFDNAAYRTSGIVYHAVVTDMVTGKPVYLPVEDVFRDMDVLRASASMPFVSRPVELDGRRYLDGGIADSIPFRWMAEQGCDRLVVVLTRDCLYRKKPMARPVVTLYRRKYPALARRLAERHLEYNRTVEELHRWEAEGRLFVLRPDSSLHIGRTESDPERLQAVYDRGQQVAREQLAALKLYLSQG